MSKIFKVLEIVLTLILAGFFVSFIINAFLWASLALAGETNDAIFSGVLAILSYLGIYPPFWVANWTSSFAARVEKKAEAPIQKPA